MLNNKGVTYNIIRAAKNSSQAASVHSTESKKVRSVTLVGTASEWGEPKADSRGHRRGRQSDVDCLHVHQTDFELVTIQPQPFNSSAGTGSAPPGSALPGSALVFVFEM